MKNCFTCKSKIVKFSDLEKVDNDMEFVENTLFVKCLAGHNKKILNFYEENGGLPAKELYKVVIDCHEPIRLLPMIPSTTSLVKIDD